MKYFEDLQEKNAWHYSLWDNAGPAQRIVGLTGDLRKSVPVLRHFSTFTGFLNRISAVVQMKGPLSVRKYLAHPHYASRTALSM